MLAMKLKRIRRKPQRIGKRQVHKRFGWQTVWQFMESLVKRQIPAATACRILDVSRSQLYALKAKWRKAYSVGPHPGWLYQRPGTGRSRLPTEVQSFLEEELRYIREESNHFQGHYNFAFLAEQCRKRFGRRFHRDSLRRWAMGQGLFDPQRDATGKPTVRFETGGIGFLFQHDSSIHLWVPAIKRKDVLILTIDDHSRKIVGARLVPRDSSWHHLCVVRETIERYGCPLTYYTDNAGIFSPQTEIHTQFSRALTAVDIAPRLTGKAQPQAKGKVEKMFDYLQRRVPYLCERYRVKNLTVANKILQEVVTEYNGYHLHAETREVPDKRWRKAMEEGRSFLRPTPSEAKLDLAFGLHYERLVKRDGAVEFAGQRWKVPKAIPGRYVTIVLRPPTGPRRPHTELFVLYKGSTLEHFVLPHKGG